MTVLATILLLALIALCIGSIENDQPERLISRNASRAKRDLRLTLRSMRRR